MSDTITKTLKIRQVKITFFDTDKGGDKVVRSEIIRDRFNDSIRLSSYYDLFVWSGEEALLEFMGTGGSIKLENNVIINKSKIIRAEIVDQYDQTLTLTPIMDDRYGFWGNIKQFLTGYYVTDNSNRRPTVPMKPNEFYYYVTEQAKSTAKVVEKPTPPPTRKITTGGSVVKPKTKKKSK